MKKVLIIPVWFLAFVNLFFLIKLYSADVYYKKSQNLVEEGRAREALEYSDLAIKNNPAEPNYYRGRARVGVLLKMKKSVYKDLQRAYSLNPNNLVTIRNSIPIYYLLAVQDYTEVPSQDNIDETFYYITQNFFRKTKAEYYTDAGVVTQIAEYEKKLGVGEDYVRSVELIRWLRPELLEWHESFR